MPADLVAVFDRAVILLVLLALFVVLVGAGFAALIWRDMRRERTRSWEAFNADRESTRGHVPPRSMPPPHQGLPW